MSTIPRMARPRPPRPAVLGASALLVARLVGVLVTFVATLVALCLVLVVVGVYFVPPCLHALSAQLRGITALHARFTGVELPAPMLPASPAPQALPGHARYVLTLLSSRDTWVLLRWAALESCVGIVIAAVPLGLIAWGFEGLVVMPVKQLTRGLTAANWYAFLPVTSAGRFRG